MKIIKKFFFVIIKLMKYILKCFKMIKYYFNNNKILIIIQYHLFFKIKNTENIF